MSSSAPFATHVSGRPAGDAPSMVLVHGWPDSAELWAPVADELSNRFHVVAVDLPGVGAAAAAPPDLRRPYRLDALATGLEQVLSTLPPDQPVHLVGHDWGGVLGWRYLVGPLRGGRVDSFTTLSGPSLDHMGLLLRRAVRDADLRPVAAAQLAKSWYTIAFSLPVLRTAMWNLGGPAGFRWWLRRSEGITNYPGRRLAQDARAAVPLYRSNIAARLAAPGIREIRVPVHVIVAERDRYVSPALMRTLDRWVPEIDFSGLDAGHWSPRSHPEEVAALIRGWIDSLDTAPDGAASG